MRAATGSEPVRKAFEVGLVNLVEDRHHSLLNDFVFQRRDAQRTLPPVGLRYIDSSSSGGSPPATGSSAVRENQRPSRSWVSLTTVGSATATEPGGQAQSHQGRAATPEASSHDRSRCMASQGCAGILPIPCCSG